MILAPDSLTQRRLEYASITNTPQAMKNNAKQTKHMSYYQSETANPHAIKANPYSK
jgi:hypothetical protein